MVSIPTSQSRRVLVSVNLGSGIEGQGPANYFYKARAWDQRIEAALLSGMCDYRRKEEFRWENCGEGSRKRSPGDYMSPWAL